MNPHAYTTDHMSQFHRDLLARLTPTTIAAVIGDLIDADAYNDGPAPADVVAFKRCCHQQLEVLVIDD